MNYSIAMIQISQASHIVTLLCHGLYHIRHCFIEKATTQICIVNKLTFFYPDPDPSPLIFSICR